MAKELPYFKFFPGEWIKGEVTLCSLEVQGLFINICAYYWMKDCHLTLTGVERRFNGCSTSVQQLLNDNIIEVKDDVISINFLDEQFSEFENLRLLKSRAGRASAKKRKGNTCSTPVQHVMNKRDKIREDKDKDNIPALKEFLSYAKEKKSDVNLESVKLKYEAWKENGWKDGNNNKIKNWKTKLLNTISYLPALKNPPAHDRTKTEGVDPTYFNELPKGAEMPESLKKKFGIK